MDRKSFVMFKNWVDAINALPEDYQLEAYKALMQYGITGSIPKGVTAITNAILIGFSGAMDSAVKHYNARVENGKKGGRPKNLEKPNNTEQNLEQPKHNLNDNDNDSDNVNDITIKEKIYKKEKYSIADIKKVCGQVSPVLYARHNEDNNADYRLGVIHKELVQYMNLEEIENLLLHANKTYIIQPKYSSLDLVWVLNNSKKVLQAEPIADIPKKEQEEAEYIEDGEYLIFKKTGARIHKETYASWSRKDN